MPEVVTCAVAAAAMMSSKANSDKTLFLILLSVIKDGFKCEICGKDTKCFANCQEKGKKNRKLTYHLINRNLFLTQKHRVSDAKTPCY